MRVLAENVHFRMTLDDERSLVRWARTAVPYDAVEQFEDVARATVLALLAIDRAKHTLLVDLRDGPMRNDEAFEQVALRFRRDVHHDFARSAVLVRSRAGKLQIDRHHTERPGEIPNHPTFLDEAEAIEFLAGKRG